MTDYKPGQIAKATVHGVPDVTVWKHAEVDLWINPKGWYLEPSEVTDVRPLVVLDPTDPTIEKFLSIYKGANPAGAYAAEFALTRMIEAQTRPAIEEPKGLGAVVEGREENRWVRTNETEHFPWRRVGPVDRVSNWAAIEGSYQPVRVLSAGVES